MSGVELVAVMRREDTNEDGQRRWDEEEDECARREQMVSSVVWLAGRVQGRFKGRELVRETDKTLVSDARKAVSILNAKE